jgi:sugar phosphate isomerase/epimerase
MPADTPLADLDEKSRLLPDAENGRIGAPAILSYLSEIGYDGPITVKPSRTAFPSRRRDMVVKLTSESLDKSWRAAGLTVAARQFLVTAHD